MNSTLKTSLVAISILCITFTLIYFYVDSFSNHLYKTRIDLESKFYSQLDSDKKKIFLLGSSHVGRLNETHIQEYLHDNNSDYEVYNLAYGAETPRNRLLYLDSMISAKPDIVVIGVGYRDFLEGSIPSDPTLLGINFPNPPADFKYGIRSIGNFLNYDFDNFRSPQLVFRYLVRDTFDFNKTPDWVGNFTKTKPFYPFESHKTIILNDTQLQKMGEGFNFKQNSLPSYDNSQDVYALNQLIETLNKNDIRVILFSTPHVKSYTDNIRSNFGDTFDDILERFSQDGVPVYLLRDKYIDLPIWSDSHHIAINSKSLIYSTDIAEIILNEIEP